ncbi:MAG TPA: AtpZ/AtpI family protein [Gammaproteobacteria bacterium]|nr:AtpZ/AtpI family protein [Gammaproteobacteria bacterium]
MELDTRDSNSEQRRLENRIDRQVERMKLAEKNRRTILSQSVYLGTLGLLFVLPVIAGAYLGSWLDERLQHFAVHWTVSMIFLGIIIGAVNVYFFIRE